MLGLVLLVIGCIRFLDMGLKAFIFTEAEKEQRINYQKPTMYSFAPQDLEEMKETEKLTSEQKRQIERMLEAYKSWEERSEEVDPVKSRRHRESASNLALILVGLPLYLYHWKVIQRS